MWVLPRRPAHQTACMVHLAATGDHGFARRVHLGLPLVEQVGAGVRVAQQRLSPESFEGSGRCARTGIRRSCECLHLWGTEVLFGGSSSSVLQTGRGLGLNLAPGRQGLETAAHRTHLERCLAVQSMHPAGPSAAQLLPSRSHLASSLLPLVPQMALHKPRHACIACQSTSPGLRALHAAQSHAHTERMSRTACD